MGLPAASTVGLVTSIAGLLLIVGVIGLGAWAIRRQNRQFPDGFDRTGWSPEPGHASCPHDVHVALGRARLAEAKRR